MLLLMLHSASVQAKIASVDDILSRQFTLHPEKIDVFFEHASVMALLKAKARTVTRQLPPADRAIYQQCEAGASTPVHMAKCVASSLDVRDRIKMQEAARAEAPPDIAYSDDERILSKLVKILWPTGVVNGPPVSTTEAVATTILTPNASTGRIATNHQDPSIAAAAATIANEDLLTPTTTAKESASAEKLRKDLKREKLRNRFKEAKRFNLNGFQDELVETHRRAIRSISQPKPHCKPARNMDALRKVQLYFELSNYVQRFTKRISVHNERFLKRLRMPVDFENRSPEASSIAKQVHEFMDDIDRGSLSILSPKIMNLLPSDDSKSSPNKLLSPNILSFHNEGVLPLPRLLGLAASSECDTLQWTDFLMELSGGASKLRTLMRKLEPELQILQEKVYPAVVKMEQTEKQWESLKRSHSLDQLKAMKKYGYTQLDPAQFEMLHGSKDHLGTTAHEYRQMSVEEREQMLEEDIRKLAEVEVPSSSNETHSGRTKRDVYRHLTNNRYVVALRPYAFQSTIGNPVAFRSTLLSPYAFANEILSPSAFINVILSPRAFIASVLSPYALVTRIVGPTAFRAEVLSPQALTAYVLSPTALTAKILSPKALETRILTPDALAVTVLSPSFGVHRYGSGTRGTVVVLSPSVLTMSVCSKDDLMVEVLSPSFFAIKPMGALNAFGMPQLG